MGNSKADGSGESELRDDGRVQAEQKKRNTDSVIRLDNEEDTLYEDGLEVEEDDAPLINTDSNKTPR